MGWTVIDDHWNGREISPGCIDNALSLLSALGAEPLMRNENDIGITNALYLNCRRVLKLRWIKREYNYRFVPLLAQAVSKIACYREGRLLDKGQLAPTRSESFNASDNIRELRATCAPMQP
jgi:hypothetical protein